MSTPAQIQTQAKPAAKSVSVTNHAQSGLVLRKCACGESAGVDGECSECREKKLTVQRRAINGAQPPAAPSSPGQPSNPGSGVQKGAGAGYNISRIRVSPAVPGRMQAKLTVNEPGDKYEQEADQVAEQVMRMAAPEDSQGVRTAGHAHIQRMDLEGERMHRQEEMEEVKGEDAEEVLQAKKASDRRADVTPELQTRINSIRRGGQPLPEAIRTFMEPRFGHDFSKVRVHTDVKAAQSAQSVNALAYTLGQNIVFGAGQYSPGTPSGKRLLAHELTHVVQQERGLGVASNKITIDPSDGVYEQEANEVSGAVTSGQGTLRVPLSASEHHVQREVPDAGSPESKETEKNKKPTNYIGKPLSEDDKTKIATLLKISAPSSSTSSSAPGLTGSKEGLHFVLHDTGGITEAKKVGPKEIAEVKKAIFPKVFADVKKANPKATDAEAKAIAEKQAEAEAKAIAEKQAEAEASKKREHRLQELKRLGSKGPVGEGADAYVRYTEDPHADEPVITRPFFGTQGQQRPSMSGAKIKCL